MNLPKLFAVITVLAPFVISNQLSPHAIAQDVESPRAKQLQLIKKQLNESNAQYSILQKEHQARLKAQNEENEQEFKADLAKDIRQSFIAQPDATQVELNFRKIDLKPVITLDDENLERSLALNDTLENQQTLEQVQQTLSSSEIEDPRTLEQIALDVANAEVQSQDTESSQKPEGNNQEQSKNEQQTSASKEDNLEVVQQDNTDVLYTTDQANSSEAQTTAAMQTELTIDLNTSSEVEETSESDLGEQVDQAASNADEVLENAENINSAEQAADLLVEVEAQEQNIEELEGELADSSDEEEISSQLAQAKADLEQARSLLADREGEIAELKKDKDSLTSAYCSQQDSINDLTQKIEAFEKSSFGQLNQRFDMLAKLMMMNLMAQSGPQWEYNPGFSVNNPRYQNFGLDNGLRLLTLNDFFHSRSMGQPMNVYNVSGNLNYYQDAMRPTSSGFDTQRMTSDVLSYPTVNSPAFEQPSFTYQFTRNGGVEDSSRFSVPDQAVSNRLIESNVSQMNNGGFIFDRAPSQSLQESQSSTNNAQNMIN